MLEGAGRKYNPFQTIEEAIRAGYRDLLKSDGEERKPSMSTDFFPIEKIPDGGLIESDHLVRIAGAPILDPLQILLKKEEEEGFFPEDPEDIEPLTASEPEEFKKGIDIHFFSGSGTYHIGASDTDFKKPEGFFITDPEDLSVPFTDTAPYFKVMKFIPFSLGQKNSFRTRPDDSHGWRGRKKKRGKNRGTMLKAKKDFFYNLSLS